MKLKKNLLRLACFLICANTFPALAQDSDDPEAQLEAVEEEIDERQERRSELEEEASTIQEEVTRLTREMVRLTRSLQQTESDLIEIEERLNTLNEEERALNSDLVARTNSMLMSLAALQRMSQRPPELLLLKPGSIENSVRTMILLSETVPSLQAEAAALSEALTELALLQERIETEKTTLTQSLASLQQKQNSMNALKTERESLRAQLLTEAEEEEARIQALTREAETLADLIRELEAANAERVQSGELDLENLDGQAFRASRGQLSFPVAGQITERFGIEKGPITTRGIRLETRPGAQVSAPFDGRVVFSGVFRGYGQLLIIAHGDGYHTLIAGMDRLDTYVGQWVLAGEPVGRMSENPEENSEKPELYLEVRRNSEPLDPLVWFAASGGKVG